MKKNILIVMTMPMGLGGVEKSLLGLLDAFDYKQYKVDLLLYAHHGELYKSINNNVHLLPEINAISRKNESLFSKLIHGCFYSLWLRLLQMVQKFDFIELDRRLVQRKMKPLEKQYDLALGFFLPFNVIHDKVTAKVKIGWVHTDYSRIRINKTLLKKMYQNVDYIAAVSESCKDTFCQILPEYSQKTIVVENILSPDFVRQRVKMSKDVSCMQVEQGELSFLSVGRYSPPKNFDNLPFIAKRLMQLGIKLKWYIIGYGGDEALIRAKIKEAGVESYVVMLGKKINPYPYMAACDFYIQPSRYEGKSVTVREAQMLYKPVIVTNYPTASSQIKHKTDGYIVPLDNEACAQGIYDFIKNKALQEKIIQHLKQNDYGNEEEIKKLYHLL